MTDKPRLTYRVTCIATLLNSVEFEVEADSPEQAIEFCINRNDDQGNYIEPTHEKFIETESETAWDATPIG